MEQLSVNYANLYAAFNGQNRPNQSNNRGNGVRFQNNRYRQQGQTAQPNRRNNNIQCYNCGQNGHISRNCPVRSNPQQNRQQRNIRNVQLLDLDEDDFYENEYYDPADSEEDEYEEDYEAEAYLNTRSTPYLSNPVSKN